MRTRDTVVVVMLLECCASHARAQDYKPGDQVVVIADAQLSVNGNGNVDKVWPELVLKVADTNAQWLWVRNGKPGWLDRRHVIPLDRVAIDHLTAMIKADPRNARLYSGRGFVWRALGESDIAIGDFSEAIRLNPDDEAYYNNRGTAFPEAIRSSQRSC